LISYSRSCRSNKHIAEKVHAYTRTYGQGHKSSRAKRSVDLVLVKQLMVLDAARLHSALVGVFEGRCQQGLPDRLPPPPTDRAVPYRKLAREVGVDPDLRAGYAEVGVLLDPVLAGHTDGRWDPGSAFWM
jgi:hypothetical protein